MAQPRFLVVSSLRLSGGRFDDGRLDRDRAERIGWRLLGGNNRELGRSARGYPDAASCDAAIALLRAEVSRTVPLVAVDQARGMWGWRLDLDGAGVAVAGRSYWRQRECLASLRLFLANVGRARVTPPVLLSAPWAGTAGLAAAVGPITAGEAGPA